MMGFARHVGNGALAIVEAGGQVILLLADVFRCLFRYPIRWRLLRQQIVFVGSSSMMVVMVTGIFVGAVFAAQTQFYFGPLGMNSAVGPTVAVSMCREFGPVICALMISGRVGAALAAELGTMKITEQIDALRALAVYPTEYLIVPRVLALVISMPILVGWAIFLGIGAGYLVFTQVAGVDGTYYWDNTLKFTDMRDVSFGLAKALVFGVIIALIGCQKGLHSGHGAEGVGRATTQAVVNASLTVLVFNFFLSLLFNQMFTD
jgi:phospholipid/cholesterol/gamma-HCH transport system permease protein